MSKFDVKKKIENNIYKITNTNNGTTRYRVIFWDKKAPLDKCGISSYIEAKKIKSKHLNEHPELLPKGRSLYETIEKHIKFNGYNYIVQITRGSGKTQEFFYEGEIETLVHARKIRDKLLDENPLILNKSKIGKGKNKLETLNKEAKNLFKEGKVDNPSYIILSSVQKRKVRDKLKN